MSDPFDPREVLAAVRRLETELDELRARARRSGQPDLDDLRRAIAADAAAERRQVVEDLETVLDLVAAAWRGNRQDTSRVLDEIAALRDEVGALRAAVEGAHLEVRFGRANGLPESAPAGRGLNGTH